MDNPMCIDANHIYFVRNDTFSTIISRINKKSGIITRFCDINKVTDNYPGKVIKNIRKIMCDETYIYVYVSGVSIFHPFIYKINKNDLSDVLRFIL